MPPTKPRNSLYKDSVVVYLALKSRFAIADNHPKEEEIMSGHGKLMLLHVPNSISLETEPS